MSGPLDVLREALSPIPGIHEKQMFGGRIFLFNGNMLCGVRDRQFMFRVGKKQEPTALEKGAVPVVLGQRKMGGLVYVEEDQCLSDHLDAWIQMALAFVGPMDPK